MSSFEHVIEDQKKTRMSSLTIYAAKILLKRAISGDLEEDTPDLTTPDDAEDSNPVEMKFSQVGRCSFYCFVNECLVVIIFLTATKNQGRP